MFAQTGYRIDRDSFWDYFTHRGGVTTFGYPVSRDFLFQGCTASSSSAWSCSSAAPRASARMNLLDEGLLPYTRINGSTFPASDPNLTARTPRATDPTYASEHPRLRPRQRPRHVRRPAGQLPEDVLQHDQRPISAAPTTRASWACSTSRSGARRPASPPTTPPTTTSSTSASSAASCTTTRAAAARKGCCSPTT